LESKFSWNCGLKRAFSSGIPDVKPPFGSGTPDQNVPLDPELWIKFVSVKNTTTWTVNNERTKKKLTDKQCKQCIFNELHS
jgi:hypothetical protein